MPPLGRTRHASSVSHGHCHGTGRWYRTASHRSTRWPAISSYDVGCQVPVRARSLEQFWRRLLVLPCRSLQISAAVGLPAEEVCVEAHLPTKQFAAGQKAWVPRPDEYTRWPRRPQGSSGQGPPPSVGLIGRFCGRACFERVARCGSRARAGVLWCTYVLDPLVSPPQVAYAIGRAAGPAVTRNLLRRRLRSLLQRKDSVLPAGLYLFGASPGATRRSYDELTFDLDRLLSKIQPPPSSTPSPSPTPSPA